MREEKAPLSVAMITLNEEKRLGAALRSVSFADEVVVVDSGSTDGTVALARELGARVFVEAWRGFGPQKRLAVERCRNDWVFILDADEVVPAETAAEIASLVAGEGGFCAYSFPRLNYFCGRAVRHGSWGRDRVVRLFNRGAGTVSERSVHEAVEVKGVVGRAVNPILHCTREDLAQTIAKLNRYSSLAAEELFRQGRRASAFSAVGHGLWAFLKDYILLLGFLDGAAGLYVAVSEGLYGFFKYAKLAELWRAAK